MDKVGDILIRIKNGYLARKGEVEMPFSKLNLAICKLLEAEAYLSKVTEIQKEKDAFKKIVVSLKYEDRIPALVDVKRISKPGLRVYKNKKSLPYVLNGLGIAIVSTPKGIMTDKQARKVGLGGEVMAYIW